MDKELWKKIIPILAWVIDAEEKVNAGSCKESAGAAKLLSVFIQHYLQLPIFNLAKINNKM